MNRKEALQILRDMFDYYWIEIEEKRRDEEITEIMEVLEQPATLADFLGWEEDVKYEWSGDWYKVKGNTISWFDAKSRVTWIDVTNIYCGVDVDLERLLEFKKNAKKVKPKFKAYHVKNKYSYDCLMKELEKQEYVWFSTGIPKGFDVFEVYRDGTVIFTENNKKMLYGDLEYYNRHEDIYELIEYHKEEPRYLLQTDLTSENGIQYLSFDKKRREYFMGALMTSENVQQKFTDGEILRIKSITRFAKLCEKVEVE